MIEFKHLILRRWWEMNDYYVLLLWLYDPSRSNSKFNCIVFRFHTIEIAHLVRRSFLYVSLFACVRTTGTASTYVVNKIDVWRHITVEQQPYNISHIIHLWHVSNGTSQLHTSMWEDWGGRKNWLISSDNLIELELGWIDWNWIHFKWEN